MLDNRKPRLPEACRMPLIKPRERTGQVSITRAAPTGHSAPIPMPSSARNSSRNHRVGEKLAMKLLTEYQAIEIINGLLRPIRSASQPAATAPTRRIHNVIVRTNATAVSGTSNSLAIGAMISRNTVKSKASNVHPSQAAHQAYHWSLVGSFHHGMLFAVWTAAIVMPPLFRRLLRQSPDAVRHAGGTIRRCLLDSKLQATESSALSTRPLVSGLSSTATIRLAHPTVVPIIIGMAKPRFQVVAR